ncbi:putative exocyst complex component Exo70, cullin repeat-like-containing domain superfamily [Helianthus annuus]|uniref:Exocyst subunit Exo70 family protein n=1 Tax=Helianthus annuus TaxID=4232 RepID=A0A251RUE5_HELAN|nr:putative exocyst complex component Exo70, cullin repeat-like-containing domain superfamily [Helianthus annuus]
MEKHSGKSGSFIGRHRWRSNLESPRSSFSHKSHHHKSRVLPDTLIHSESSDDLNDSIPLPDDVDHNQILAHLDAFAHQISNIEDKTTPPELPDVIDTFSAIIKSKTRKSTVDEDNTFLYESVHRLCKLKTALAEFSNMSQLDKIGKLLRQIMKFMEEELRALLVDSHVSPEPKLKVISSKHFSFKSERCPIPEPSKEEDYPGFSEEDISKMNKIVKTMMSAGYKNECSNAYSIARGNALYEQLKRLNFEKLNAEEVQKLSWEWLEADITRGLFVNLIRSLITSLLDYAATVAMLKPSAERLFKFLDMYEVLHGLKDAINGEEHESCNDLNSEISSVIERIAEGVVNMFGDLEKSIRHDAAKTPVPGGAVHPLTRYVLNYLRYACDYVDTLEQIFQQSAKLNQLPTSSSSPPEDMDMEKSPLAAQIASVMSLLDGNLAVKSTLYKDPSLRDIFLMNNGRYILQKVKGSSEIKKMLGDNWCRRRSSEVRHYHKSYQRETWARLLQCITQEGILVNGKVNKKVLKERFKNFNAMFDEIHKTQGPWVVSDEQLQSELRASISAVVIPAYRSFVGRYKHHFEAGKNIDKYIKYQPEDIEALIETLFEGNHSTSMSRRRF